MQWGYGAPTKTKTTGSQFLTMRGSEKKKEVETIFFSHKLLKAKNQQKQKH